MNLASDFLAIAEDSVLHGVTGAVFMIPLTSKGG